MSETKVQAHVLGYPRLGPRRELKWALERHWSGKAGEEELAAELLEVRRANWRAQAGGGMTAVTAGDFAYYDHVLELAEAFGVVPARHENGGDRLARCFSMARGGEGGRACEMKKWFNTNYHYLVPELEPGQQFSCASAGAQPADAVTQAREAAEAGLPVKAVMTGPVTFLYLAKLEGKGEFHPDKLEAASRIHKPYAAAAARLKAAGAEWLQLDEPVLSLDMPEEWRKAMEAVYEGFIHEADRPKVMVANYYGSAGGQVDLVSNLGVEGFHVDLRNGLSDLEAADRRFAGKALSVGAVDGRNVWRANLPELEKALAPLAGRDGGLWVGSSCPMIHVPVDASGEKELLDKGLPIAFARQKLDEIAALARTLSGEATDADRELFASSPAFPVSDPGWVDGSLPAGDLKPSERGGETGLSGVFMPTTTIGSLPQTAEIRKARAQWRKKEIGTDEYDERMRDEIRECVAAQEELGLDMLVHGECERNDMVEYFANLLDGIDAPRNGWVQSYGSRATRPPIIHGAVSRPEPMTLRWSEYAAGLTDRPMKGMLTGPVTIICWSFPRADAPRMRTAFEIADALRDEVADLGRAGLPAIQIDEPALREGLPLRAGERPAYLAQAVASFNRIVEGCEAQIHTHMCYGEFNDVAAAIAAMDADVISLETSRTDMSVLSALSESGHSAGVGPGVYDVHSPRVPEVGEMEELLRKAMEWVPAERLWVNPDCGLKTRGWEETRLALRNMVKAAERLRESGAAS